jgi:hypothetical protein
MRIEKFKTLKELRTFLNKGEYKLVSLPSPLKKDGSNRIKIEPESIYPYDLSLRKAITPIELRRMPCYDKGYDLVIVPYLLDNKDLQQINRVLDSHYFINVYQNTKNTTF